MKTLTRMAAVLAFTGLSVVVTQQAMSGGDDPFPLTDEQPGDQQNIELKEVWEGNNGVKVKYYRNDKDESFVVVETQNPKKVEILKRTK